MTDEDQEDVTIEALAIEVAKAARETFRTCNELPLSLALGRLEVFLVHRGMLEKGS